MQPLNVTKLTPEQFEQPMHKLPNYTMVDYDSLKEQIQKINENYPFSMPAWIPITVLSTFLIIIGIVIFLYCKYRCTSNKSKTSSKFLCKRNKKEAEAMLPSSSQQSTTSREVKVTPEKK